MPTLVVVNNPADWCFDLPGVQVVPAWSYLTDAAFSRLKGVRLFNLCRSYRYQSMGYYVSLLAAARGHKPLPMVSTIQDLKSPGVIRVVSDDLYDRIQKALAPIQGDAFTLSIYFGRNVARRYDALATSLYRNFEAPLLRAQFRRVEGEWELRSIGAIAASEIPASHMDFVRAGAQEFFAGRRAAGPRRQVSRYDLAILVNEAEPTPPSDDVAIKRFLRAARKVGLNAEVVSREDAGRLAEFDGLFLRETTAVNHHTYRLARKAEAEGLVVIDDPASILKCTNKVYLAEILDAHKVPTPRTAILHQGHLGAPTPDGRSVPVILKQPDSSFSQGVVKVDTPAEYDEALGRLLEKSALVIAQEFVPTDFDWRIGVLEGRPLYACKYFMARKHWQILKKDGATGALIPGRWETLPVELVPRVVVRTAVKAAGLIGEGLYGVDLKQLGKKAVVIEVNDNPTLESGVEDQDIGDELYSRIMAVFLKRIVRLKEAGFRYA